MVQLPASLECSLEFVGKVVIRRPTEDQVIAYQEATVHLANRAAPLDPLKTGREVLLDLVEPPERRDEIELHLDDYPGDQDVLVDAFQKLTPPLDLVDRTSDEDRKSKRVRVAVGYTRKIAFGGRPEAGLASPGPAADDPVVSLVDETGVPVKWTRAEEGAGDADFIVGTGWIRQVAPRDLSAKQYLLTVGERIEIVMRRFDGRDWPALQRAATNNWGFIPDGLLVEHAMKRVQVPDASSLDDYRKKWPHLAFILARVLHAAARPSRLGPK